MMIVGYNKVLDLFISKRVYLQKHFLSMKIIKYLFSIKKCSMKRSCDKNTLFYLILRRNCKKLYCYFRSIIVIHKKKIFENKNVVLSIDYTLFSKV